MAITRRRVFDGVAALTGVLVLLLALMVFDRGTRHAWSGAELSTMGENVNYLAFAITLMVAQVVRGEITEHVQLLVFMVTAVVLVVLLMRM
jgi:GAF domain-containing protein